MPKPESYTGKISAFKRMTLFFSVMVWVSLFLFCAAHAREDVIVIANKHVEFDSLTRDTISNIYQAETTKWDNGNTIIVVMQKRGSIHEKFSNQIVGVTTHRLRDIWRNVIFTGLGKPPRIFRDEKALVSYIRETNDSIGYINSTTPHQGVKVISITD